MDIRVRTRIRMWQFSLNLSLNILTFTSYHLIVLTLFIWAMLKYIIRGCHVWRYRWLFWHGEKYWRIQITNPFFFLFGKNKITKRKMLSPTKLVLQCFHDFILGFDVLMNQSSSYKNVSVIILTHSVVSPHIDHVVLKLILKAIPYFN